MDTNKKTITAILILLDTVNRYKNRIDIIKNDLNYLKKLL